MKFTDNKPACPADVPGQSTPHRKGLEHMKQNGFTLIEMLVVIAILAILMSLIAPAVGRAQRSAQNATCQSNLRQIGLAFQNYAVDHRGRMARVQIHPPVHGFWVDNVWPGILRDYLGMGESTGHVPASAWTTVTLCPAELRAEGRTPANTYFTYGVNSNVNSVLDSLGATRSPSQTMLAGCGHKDPAHNPWWASLQLSRLPHFRHNGRSNFVYFDGHVSSLREEELPLAWNDVFWRGSP
jgi:prepilin-type N-terminal cleavage/methylation domain-containing protein/prepilin-type processing-associated H-X9-DG protein